MLNTSLTLYLCFQKKEFSHECEASDVQVLLFKFRLELLPMTSVKFLCSQARNHLQCLYLVKLTVL